MNQRWRNRLGSYRSPEETINPHRAPLASDATPPRPSARVTPATPDAGDARVTREAPVLPFAPGVPWPDHDELATLRYATPEGIVAPVVVTGTRAVLRTGPGSVRTVPRDAWAAATSGWTVSDAPAPWTVDRQAAHGVDSA